MRERENGDNVERERGAHAAWAMPRQLSWLLGQGVECVCEVGWMGIAKKSLHTCVHSNMSSGGGGSESGIEYSIEWKGIEWEEDPCVCALTLSLSFPVYARRRRGVRVSV